MRPHPFFWAVLAALGLGVAAAITVRAAAPPIALYSVSFYRVEVGLGVFLTGYVIVLILYLSYLGRVVTLRLPGGASVEPGMAELQDGVPEDSARFKH
jgi:hypothetical protein